MADQVGQLSLGVLLGAPSGQEGQLGTRGAWRLRGIGSGEAREHHGARLTAQDVDLASGEGRTGRVAMSSLRLPALSRSVSACLAHV